LAQWFMKIVGVVLVLVGIVGFFIPFTGLLDLTPAHDIVHLATGAVFLGVSGSEKNSVLAAKIFGAVYLLVAVLGLFTRDVLGLVMLMPADTVLHFIIAVAALVVGFGGKAKESANHSA
jgi:hypothetical protein